MGVDWYPCANCGDTFPDCGHYWSCETCGHMICSRCEKEIIKRDEETEDEDVCPFCNDEIATDYELLCYALRKLGMTREELVAERAAPDEGLTLYIDPGQASVKTITDVLVSLSDLHQAFGGPGFTFHADGMKIIAVPKKQEEDEQEDD
jgi:DNA-directed RNA polymerase subunit RPC12/RpoP